VNGRRKFVKGQRKTISDVPGFNGTWGRTSSLSWLQCASVPIIPLVIGRYRYLLRWDVRLHHTDMVMVKRGCVDMQ
jgi:hypothetical protein